VQPKTQRTDENVDKIRTLVHSDRKLCVKVMATGLNISREIVRRNEKEDMGMRKISAQMVPRILIHDKKQRRLHILSDL